MKKKLCLSILCYAGMATAQNPTFEWLQTPDITFGSNPDMAGYSVAADPEGNVYFSGFKSEPFNYNELMGSQFFNKYDANGQLIFEKEIGGKASAQNMITDSQGNVIIALCYVQNITIDQVTITTIEQGEHFVLAKFNGQGSLLWHRLIESQQESSWISDMRGLAIDSNDNIYIGYGDFMDSYIDKYAPDGTRSLAIVQENVSTATSVSIDTEGNIYVAGSCADLNAEFAGTLVPTDLQYNTYVVKYSPQGVHQWVKFVEDITCPQPAVVARTPDEVYFSSYLFGAYDFDDIPTTGPDSGMFDDFFLAKLNASGVYQWVREVEGISKTGQGNRSFLDIDAEGNIYFTGFTGGEIDWGNGITTDTPLMGNDVIVLKYDPAGTVLMAKTAGGEGYDNSDAISVSGNGDIFVTGTCNGPATFDSFVHDANPYGYYPFITKINSGTMGTDKPIEDKIMLYPNPASSALYISGLEGKINGCVINMLGQKVSEFEVDVSDPLQIGHLPPGTYLLKAEGMPAMKFVKY
ncbi:T9SS type A sorting domain-containing protein [Flavobacterium sp.]|uniref:T9SS type A sorting domain-containing protein n=3 Tax=Flavobacterium sp. TaxID=239 RepID=UPI00403321A2